MKRRHRWTIPEKYRTATPEPAVSLQEAARRLGITVPSVRYAVKVGKLQGVEVRIPVWRPGVLVSSLRAYRPSEARIRAGKGRATSKVSVESPGP